MDLGICAKCERFTTDYHTVYTNHDAHVSLKRMSCFWIGEKHFDVDCKNYSKRKPPKDCDYYHEQLIVKKKVSENVAIVTKIVNEYFDNIKNMKKIEHHYQVDPNYSLFDIEK